MLHNPTSWAVTAIAWSKRFASAECARITDLQESATTSEFGRCCRKNAPAVVGFALDGAFSWLEESVAHYLSQLDTADRLEPAEALATKVTRLAEKLTKLKEEMGKLAVYEKQVLASTDQQISLTDSDSRSIATNGRGSGVVG
jgi:hypothetical protein